MSAGDKPRVRSRLRLLPLRPPLGRRHRERHRQAESGGERAERAEIAFDDLEADVGEARERGERAVGEDDGRGFRPAGALGEVDGEGRIGGEADRDKPVDGPGAGELLWPRARMLSIRLAESQRSESSSGECRFRGFTMNKLARR